MTIKDAALILHHAVRILGPQERVHAIRLSERTLSIELHEEGPAR